MKQLLTLALICLLSVSLPLKAEQSKAPEDAKSYFVNLKDGDVVKSPVKIIFGLKGMGVAPAGVEKAHTGHHHIFLNRPPLGKGEDGAEEFEANIPADENHIHFGKGQTEITLDLKPGKHTLQLVLGDHNHIPHKPPVVSDVITITVQK